MEGVVPLIWLGHAPHICVRLLVGTALLTLMFSCLAFINSEHFFQFDCVQTLSTVCSRWKNLNNS